MCVFRPPSGQRIRRDCLTIEFRPAIIDILHKDCLSGDDIFR